MGSFMSTYKWCHKSDETVTFPTRREKNGSAQVLFPTYEEKRFSGVISPGGSR